MARKNQLQWCALRGKRHRIGVTLDSHVGRMSTRFFGDFMGLRNMVPNNATLVDF